MGINRVNLRQQSGAVLLISMIMLILLSLIGVTGIQVATLEEKMAGNGKDSNIAFQKAESALRYAEKELKSSTLPVFNNTLGYYEYSPNVELWKMVDWTDNTETKVYNTTLGGVSPLAARYIVEELPPITELEAGTPRENKYYRITTHAVGTTTASVVSIQSVYKK